MSAGRFQLYPNSKMKNQEHFMTGDVTGRPQFSNGPPAGIAKICGVTTCDKLAVKYHDDSPPAVDPLEIMHDLCSKHAARNHGVRDARRIIR